MELIKCKDTKYEEYETLLLERDQAQKEGGQIWTAYLKVFGQLITEVYEAKLECIKCKKMIAYYQNAVNHGGSVDADAMQVYLKKEMAQYYENLRRMVEANTRIRESGESTEYEVSRSKVLYRRLAKLLHPDINSETDRNPSLIELWNRIVIAYGHNDIKALSELEVLAGKAMKDLGLGRVKIVIPEIDSRIEELKEEINEIRSTEPYTYRDLLEDEDATERKKTLLTKELEEYKSYRDQLNGVIDDILTKGGVTLRWQMK